MKRATWCIGLFLAGLCLAPRAYGDPTLEGRWRAVLPGADPPVELILTVAPGGETEVAVASSGEGTSPIRVSVSVEGRTVRFRATGLAQDLSFEGELSADGKTIAGSLTPAAPAVPSTDIWLVEIDPSAAPWQVSAVTNVTDRDGYDNQPQFTRDGRGFLYTSIRDGQADIYRYDLKERSAVQLTKTPETSEYSPTPLPDEDSFSTVRVEEDGTQRLWAFDRDGESPRLVLTDIKPVGYHAWLNPTTLALFVLGEPNTLQIASLPSGWAKTVGEDIGRSLHRAPDGAVTYVHKAAEDDWRIERLSIQGLEPAETIARALPGNEDFTWLPDGRLLAGGDSLLQTFRPGDAGWTIAADLASHDVRGITRLAAHSDGRLLAVVADRPAASAESVPLTLTRVNADGAPEP